MWHAVWHWLISLPGVTDFWNPFWAAAFGALAGAAAAFELERRRREAERVRYELGQCHILLFIVIRMASTVRDFQEQLFEPIDGRERVWHEIGTLSGAPLHGPEFAFKDYAFLLDGSETKSDAPGLLNKVYVSTINFQANVDRLRERNELWQQLQHVRFGSAFVQGEEAAEAMGHSAGLQHRIHELTEWLREDVPEGIAELDALQTVLPGVIRARFPTKHFIRSELKPGPTTPAPSAD
ncbi:MAG TPA: hypothetical protein VMU40_05145 [Steroidobacteraceae bacterium]|nr:hypothetical protein [Steroidobacteraceae bacterium]